MGDHHAVDSADAFPFYLQFGGKVGAATPARQVREIPAIRAKMSERHRPTKPSKRGNHSTMMKKSHPCKQLSGSKICTDPLMTDGDGRGSGET